MATYRVAFDGKWQGKFGQPEEALEWAEAVGETGRLTHVVQFGYLLRWIIGPKLIAVFPEDRAADGRILWEARTLGSWVGGGGGGSG
jgi:hypothetical protein